VKPVGKFSDELKSESIIWRPIYAGKVTLAEVKSGACDLIDILKLNAFLDAEAAQTYAAMKADK
jgi:hypothetical protein